MPLWRHTSLNNNHAWWHSTVQYFLQKIILQLKFLFFLFYFFHRDRHVRLLSWWPLSFIWFLQGLPATLTSYSLSLIPANDVISRLARHAGSYGNTASTELFSVMSSGSDGINGIHEGPVWSACQATKTYLPLLFKGYWTPLSKTGIL